MVDSRGLRSFWRSIHSIKTTPMYSVQFTGIKVERQRDIPVSRNPPQRQTTKNIYNRGPRPFLLECSITNASNTTSITIRIQISIILRIDNLIDILSPTPLIIRLQPRRLQNFTTIPPFLQSPNIPFRNILGISHI